MDRRINSDYAGVLTLWEEGRRRRAVRADVPGDTPIIEPWRTDKSGERGREEDE